MSAQMQIKDSAVSAAGMELRYLELGAGKPVIFLHGGSLGSSADVFTRNLPAFAAGGFRAIAFDQPGFGLSCVPQDHSVGQRRKSVLAFMDALGLSSAAIVAHSQAGGMATQIALDQPERVTHLAILGTGSLLPPLEEAREGNEGAAQQRLERRMATHEPTIEDTRKLLEANLFHHELITDEALSVRHARSTGRNFEAFVARSALPAVPKDPGKPPLWTRLTELRQPLLMIYGRNDRANAYERALKLKEMFPKLDMRIAPDCKHLVPWDAQALVEDALIPFLR
jgi:4,5:9,10-diseco-3-hydroxy-5,9,17-trioxoandrosta-1(10),2-diene-4-oate hydrolase